MNLWWALPLEINLVIAAREMCGKKKEYIKPYKNTTNNFYFIIKINT